jgi:putative ATP-dependent endonuclease of OLD family
MVTTHSPSFIDISRDNTTVVRVERATSGSIIGTTVFHPDKVNLTSHDKELLKLLNQWDPHVGEFFFGSRNIIVEGDTEFSAFREIIEKDRAKYRNVHVVRARGKYIIPIIIKIMNQFGSPYAVLHDTDTPTLNSGKANPAWRANEQILAAAKAAPDPSKVRLAASVVDFEHALFGERASSDKPYHTVMKIRNDAFAEKQVSTLLDYLLFMTEDPPAGVLAWDHIGDLESVVAAEVTPAAGSETAA